MFRPLGSNIVLCLDTPGSNNKLLNSNNFASTQEDYNLPANEHFSSIIEGLAQLYLSQFFSHNQKLKCTSIRAIIKIIF